MKTVNYQKFSKEINLSSLSAEGIDRSIRLMIRSIELRAEQRFVEALACLDEILVHSPDFSPAFLNRATLLSDLRRHDEALAQLRKLPAKLLDQAEFVGLREELRKFAIADYGTTLRIKPTDYDTQFRLSNVYLYNDEYRNAAGAYNALLLVKPLHVGALNNLGYAELMLNRLDHALNAYDQLVEFEPLNAVNHYNRGNVLKEQCLIDEAEAAYLCALQIAPDFAEAHTELAHCLLMKGFYKKGWVEFEWRWRTTQLKDHAIFSDRPRWRSAATDVNVNDEKKITLLIWAEQGYGDTLQFARYAVIAAIHVGRIILRVPPALYELLASLDSRFEMADDTMPLPAHDFHCPIMSLPLALGLGDLPSPIDSAYLAPPTERVAPWAQYLAPLRRPRVGLAWAGSQIPQVNRNRDIPLEALLPLVELPLDFVCLQPELSQTDAILWEKFPGLRPKMADFSDTAAIIAQLDLVISVDTAIAHLAGALNKPCFLLLRHNSEWRWQLLHDSTKWYYRTTLLRQSRERSWIEVVAELRRILMKRFRLY